MSRSRRLLISLAITALIVAVKWSPAIISRLQRRMTSAPPAPTISIVQTDILSQEGVILPITWDDLGAKMLTTGVIEEGKFRELYKSRGGLGVDESLLTGTTNPNIKITPQNSHIVLNLLWAFGLANKNPILDTGPMVDKQYGSAGNFASTGGWTLARGTAMDHYSKHRFLVLNSSQQKQVERVAQNIYRPCCNNSTYFPDCNHGMAMLGLLELLAAAGVSEQDMYRYALQVNAYWFPETYLTIAKLKQTQGVAWKDVDPQEILGPKYSSAAGYSQVLSQVQPEKYGGSGSCGV